jgi:hypothetical protein
VVDIHIFAVSRVVGLRRKRCLWLFNWRATAVQRYCVGGLESELGSVVAARDESMVGQH